MVDWSFVIQKVHEIFGLDVSQLKWLFSLVKSNAVVDSTHLSLKPFSKSYALVICSSKCLYWTFLLFPFHSERR